MTSSPFNPIQWAVAAVIVLLFGAVAYRVVKTCEPTNFELIQHLKVTLGGCPAPAVEKPTRPVTSEPKYSGETAPKRRTSDPEPRKDVDATPSANEPTPPRERPSSPPSVVRSPAGSETVATSTHTIAELQNLRATAKLIFSTTRRDQELATVARLATESREYRVAIDIAGDIFSTTTRDRVFADIACSAVYVSGDKPAGEAATAKVFSTAKRDEIYQAVVQATAARKNEGRDPCSKR